MRFAQRAAPLLILLGWFLFLIHRGFTEQFNTDDMTNLCVAFLKGFTPLIRGAVLFWTGSIRPLGEMFYLAVYQFAGFKSLPFRVASALILILNFFLLYALFRRFTPTREFAFLALALVCYHASMSDIYMSTGTIYDILCQTFILLALLCGFQDRPRWILAALCAIAAVDSKEMGVSIPAVLLAAELLLRPLPNSLPHWVRTRSPAVLSTSVVSLLFLYSRLGRANELSHLPAYQVALTWHRYVETTAAYLNQLAFQGRMGDRMAIAILGTALLPALLLRNRLMMFGWLYYLLALLPMSFATPRASGYVLYIPIVGAGLYGAALFFQLRQVASRRWNLMAPALTGIAICAITANQYAQYRYPSLTIATTPAARAPSAWSPKAFTG